MKLISKLLEMFLYGILSFPDPHLHRIISKMRNQIFTKKKLQIIPKKTNPELCQNSAKNMTDYEAASLTMIFRNRQKKSSK